MKEKQAMSNADLLRSQMLLLVLGLLCVAVFFETLNG